MATAQLSPLLCSCLAGGNPGLLFDMAAAFSALTRAGLALGTSLLPPLQAAYRLETARDEIKGLLKEWEKVQ